MVEVEKFSNLPKHMSLIKRATELLSKDKRVKGLFIAGSDKADEFSDIDYCIVATEEDIKSLKNERVEIANKIGNYKAESMSLFPNVYVVFYEEEVKFDFIYSSIPLTPRPRKALYTNLYDPEGYVKEMIEESSKLDYEINLDEFTHFVNHFFIGISYTVSKFLRGELWDAEDCIDWYRKKLIQFEDILAKRKREGYRRTEEKLDEKRLKKLSEMLVKELTREELFRTMDAVLEYFDLFLRDRIEQLNIFPYEDAKNMLEYYNRKKNEVLSGE
ncbi:MAG: hypothetical protein ACXABK_02045 [Candidatus Heimdallarchaeaceae archaeon]|jgi:hypothetical protein